MTNDGEKRKNYARLEWVIVFGKLHPHVMGMSVSMHVNSVFLLIAWNVDTVIDVPFFGSEHRKHSGHRTREWVHVSVLKIRDIFSRGNSTSVFFWNRITSNTELVVRNWYFRRFENDFRKFTRFADAFHSNVLLVEPVVRFSFFFRSSYSHVTIFFIYILIS